MAVKTTKEKPSPIIRKIKQALKKGLIEFETYDYSFTGDWERMDDGSIGLNTYADCDSGVSLIIPQKDMDYHYEFTNLDSQDHEPTYGWLKKMKLDWLCEKEHEDDHLVRRDELHPILLDECAEREISEQAGIKDAEAEFIADAYMDKYEEAEGFVVHSPRGFGNEFSIYAYRAGEEDACYEWATKGESQNSWTKLWTRKKCRQQLISSNWYGLQSDSIYRQQEDCSSIDGYWTNLKTKYEAEV